VAVSRLDTFKLLVGQTGNTTGNTTATEFPLASYPINGMVAVHMSGTFGGGTATIEVTADGVNWVPPVTAPASLLAPGVLVWQGSALGVRAKLTGATSPNLNATAVFADMY
jgi:hypothetical protein